MVAMVSPIAFIAAAVGSTPLFFSDRKASLAASTPITGLSFEVHQPVKLLLPLCRSGVERVVAAISAASVPSLIIGGLGVAADVTAIASGATEEVNPQASSILGWLFLGTGLVGAFEGVARLTYKGIMRATEGVRQRAATILEVGLSGRGAVKAGRVCADEGQDVMAFLRADDGAPTEIKKYGGFTVRSADSRANILSRFKKSI